MRRLVLFLFVFVFFRLCNGESHNSNCSEVTLSCVKILVRPTNSSVGPTKKKLLETAADSLATLADAKLEKIAEKFLKIKPDKFIGILKGLSIAGNIIAVFMESENTDTQFIVTEMQKSFDKFSNQMETEFATLKMFIGERFFDINVLNPVKAVTKKMNAVLKSKGDKGGSLRQNFVRSYKEANIDIVLEHIFKNTKQRFEAIAQATDFNETIYNSTKDGLTRVYFQTYAVRAYLIGIASQCMDGTRALTTLEKEANSTQKEFTKLISDVSTEFYSTFFPFKIEEKIVKPLVDQHSNKSNCEIASAILQRIYKSYPWRHYAVIVLDETSGNSNYFHVGYGHRQIIVERYGKKNVIIFMGTPKFLDNAKKYQDNKDRSRIQKQPPLWSGDLTPIANVVKEGGNYHQLALIWHDYNDCLKSSHPKLVDAFENNMLFTVSRGGGTLKENNLNYYIVF